MIKDYATNETHVTRIISAKNKLIAVCENEVEQKKFANHVALKFSELCEVELPDRENRRIKALKIEIWTKLEDLKIYI
jgi:hypothetical protein